MLRHELQPLAVQQHVLHSLAALLLRSPHASAPSSPAAGGTAGSPGSSGSRGWGSTPALAAPSAGSLPVAPEVSEEQLAEGRAALLDQLHDSLHDSLLIPERRLEELVEQVRGWFVVLVMVVVCWRVDSG